MKTLTGIMLGACVILSASCGGGSDSPPAPELSPEAGPPPSPEEPAVAEDVGFNLNEKTLAGEAIPLNMRRSNIDLDQTTAMCEPGDVPVFDTCYASIEIDESLDIKLTTKSGETQRLAELPEIASTYEKQDEGVYKYSNPRGCENWCARSDILDNKITIVDNQIVKTTLDMRYFYGQVPFDTNPRGFASAHIWVVNGSVNLGGVVLKSPFTVGDVLDQVPDARYNEDKGTILYRNEGQNQSVLMSFGKYKIQQKVQEIAGERNYFIDTIKIDKTKEAE